ncbi:BatA domain-containing protein [Zunongwangia endophytica]|uniref:BatA domain-containing protein n=1 Tax=Zunongwangia endophytica TaxID=1808945 RepID=A0ABV8H3L0_9FLAO|nr:BatA domain-containing protein [Zunongwangia endophytica]MDN3594289.1 BatA domain-containing protein [Zunongwangia endophytica]
MQFKYPEVLYALILLVIPFIVHLFKFRRFQKEAFTNVKFLKKVVQENRKSNQLKKWLILTARTLALGALILAFAQPFFPSGKTAKQTTSTLFYLDNSFSMQLRGEHGPMLAYNIQQFLENAEDDTSFGLFTNTNDFGIISPKENLAEIQNIDYSSNSLNFDIINLKAQQFFKNHPAELQRLVLVSDFQQNLGKLDKLDNVEYHFVKNEPQEIKNISIDSAFVIDKNLNHINLKATFSNTEKLDRDIAITLKNGEQILAKKSINFKEDKKQEIEFRLQAEEIENGVITIEDNGLYYDNELFFSSSESPKIKVISVSDQDSDFLNRIFTEDQFEYTNFTEEEVDYSVFSNADVIILNEVKQLNTALQNQLIEGSKKGVTICIIPPSELSIENYNQLLSNLNLPLLQQKQNRELLITDIAFQHPIFDNTFEKEIDNFQYPQVQTSYNFTSIATAALSFQNNDAFLLNSGQNYMFSAAINQQNSNFQNSPLIVPVFYNMGISAIKIPDLYFEVGQENSFDVNISGNADQVVEIQQNSGDSFIPLQQNTSDKITVTTSNLPETAGNFMVAYQDEKILPISYNYPRQESKLNYLDINEFVNIEKQPNLNTYFETVKAAQQIDVLWKWFVIFALIFLTIEMLLLKFFK